MTTIINLTPHAINLVAQDGVETVLAPSGTVARVSSTPGTVEAREGFPCLVASPTLFGAVSGVPDPQDGVVLIVSGMVGAAMVGSGRLDVMMPGTGPHDGVRRNEAGHITGVTRLLRVS
jgi:hypothetical protein